MKAKTKQAQAILPVFDMPQSGILLKQWRSMRVPAILTGFISPMAGPGAWKIFDGKIGGLLNACFEIGSAIPTEKYEPARKFYNDYIAKYGQPLEAGHGPAPSYDSVYILADAIERAGTLDPERVVAQIRRPTGRARSEESGSTKAIRSFTVTTRHKRLQDVSFSGPKTANGLLFSLNPLPKARSLCLNGSRRQSKETTSGESGRRVVSSHARLGDTRSLSGSAFAWTRSCTRDVNSRYPGPPIDRHGRVEALRYPGDLARVHETGKVFLTSAHRTQCSVS